MEINKHNYQKVTSVKAGDRVVFTDNYIYLITSAYLRGVDIENESIFRKIGVINQKMSFCEEAYGYEPEVGFWPEYKSNDYDAALRIIKKIFDKMYPELKKKEETITSDASNSLAREYNSLAREYENPSKSIKTNPSDMKFTIKVSTIKPKIIL